MVRNIDSFYNDSIENLGEMMGDDRLENKAWKTREKSINIDFFIFFIIFFFFRIEIKIVVEFISHESIAMRKQKSHYIQFNFKQSSVNPITCMLVNGTKNNQ